MACIVNRGTKDNPKWYASYKDIDGKWKQRNTKQLTKKDAEIWAAEVEARVRRGLVGVPEPVKADASAPAPAPALLTVDGLIDRFLAEYTSPKIKRDLEGYRRHASALLMRVRQAPIAKLPAAQVRPVDVARWRDAQTADGQANSTVNRILNVFGAVFRWAMDQEIIPVGKNPVHKTERLRETPSEAFYTMQQVQRLLALPREMGAYNAGGPSTRRTRSFEKAGLACPAMLITALYTGMRKGELFGLKWEHVHLDADPPRIEVRHSYTDTPKNGKARVIPIHPELLPVLREWKQTLEAMPPGTSGELPTAEGLVFPVAVHDVLRRVRKWRMGYTGEMAGIVEMLKAADIKPPADPWHACRHTLATHLTEATGNEHAVSLILGHSISGSTAGAKITRAYSHPGLVYLHRELCKMTLWPDVPRPGAAPKRRRKTRLTALWPDDD